MENHITFITIGLLFFMFGLISKRIENSIFSAPMVFMVVGVLLGNQTFGIVKLHISSEEVKFIAEITLVMILFTDASLIRFKKLREILAGIPGRLLGIGLPLTMILGAVVAMLMFNELAIWMALLMALILSPTDAALGQAVVKNHNVPENIRNGISVESGLNDGIALPPILMCIAALSLSLTGSENTEHSNWYAFFAMQVLLGPLAGALVGKMGGLVMEHASRLDLMNPVFQRLSSPALGISAFAFAELIGGNGFIAAFFAGLLLSTDIKIVRERITEYGEANGQLLSLIVFFILGAGVIPYFAPYWDLNALIYALLSLTLIRIIPVFICLIGTKLDTYSTFFISWFGPRGIASVLYLLLVVTELGPEGIEYPLSIIVLTISISVLAHGATAVWMCELYGKRNDANTQEQRK